jgi:hypothetical protein
VSSSLEDALASPSPFIRALALLDRRVGKRRLRLMEVENEHPIVRELFALRWTAEENMARKRGDAK